jgi:hypothetical protein
MQSSGASRREIANLYRGQARGSLRPRQANSESPHGITGISRVWRPRIIDPETILPICC